MIFCIFDYVSFNHSFLIEYAGIALSFYLLPASSVTRAVSPFLGIRECFITF